MVGLGWARLVILGAVQVVNTSQNLLLVIRGKKSEVMRQLYGMCMGVSIPQNAKIYPPMDGLSRKLDWVYNIC